MIIDISGGFLIGIFFGFAFGFMVGGVTFCVVIYFPNIKNLFSSIRFIYHHIKDLDNKGEKR
jgi:hypothetical protein